MKIMVMLLLSLVNLDAKTFTWRIDEISSNLSRQEASQVIKSAWQQWERFVYVEDEYIEGGDAEVTFRWLQGDHNDGWPFDGPGGVLAHTLDSRNPYPWKDQIHFDLDDDWGNTEKFYSIVVHEIGHILGLQHTKSFDSIMYPFYHPTRYFTPEDIQNVSKFWPMKIRIKLPERKERQ